MNALLVYPDWPDTYWSFKHALPFQGKRSAYPPLGLLTIAALLPPQWAKRLVEAVHGDVMQPTSNLDRLNPQTVLAFDTYIRAAETAMEQAPESDSFLWSDCDAKRDHQVRAGKIPAQFWSGSQPLNVPLGLIHDWIGAAMLPGATVDLTLGLIQDYDNHKNIYRPDVIDSKMISRSGDDFKIYLRLLKKKVITVVLDTDHDVHYSRLSPSRCLCRSYTTRITEVQDAGQPNETILPPDFGHGFLWRLYSYWKFLQRNEGTFIECRAISLTRDIPASLKWVIQPIIRSLPRDALVNTLASTRAALATHNA